MGGEEKHLNKLRCLGDTNTHLGVCQLKTALLRESIEKSIQMKYIMEKLYLLYFVS